MSRALDLTGQRFERLIALTRVNNIRDKGRHVYWSCRCDCGSTVIVRGTGLKDGMHKSCGCWRVQASRERAITFKQAGHNLFGIVYIPKTPAIIRANSLDRHVVLSYPYLGSGTINSCDLLIKINNIVPKGLPNHLRADISQEMITDILCGLLDFNNAEKNINKYIRRVDPDRYKTISLHTPLTNGKQLLDMIPSEKGLYT